MLDSLETIRQSSPQFVEAYLLESRVARRMFDITRSAGYLDHSRDMAKAAAEIDPQDPRPPSQLFDVSLRAGDIDTAREAIEQLRRIDPGDVEVLRREAQVLKRDGHVERAIELMREVVDRRPSYFYLIELIDMEYDHGMVDAARSNLERLLERFPGDAYARPKMAELELIYGDARRAEQLYTDLASHSPGGTVVTNLGLAQELLGKYDDAATNFRRAIKFAPSDPNGYLNLADCEKMAGRQSRADSLYGHVITLIQADVNPAELSNLRMRAQSLAHLGKAQDAVGTIQEALRKDPENAWTLYAAAVVYTTIGEKTSAMVAARSACQKGVQARWFKISLFDTLQDQAEFREIVASDPIASAQRQ